MSEESFLVDDLKYPVTLSLSMKAFRNQHAVICHCNIPLTHWVEQSFEVPRGNIFNSTVPDLLHPPMRQGSLALGG